MINRIAKWTHLKPKCCPLKTMCSPTLFRTHQLKAKLHSHIGKRDVLGAAPQFGVPPEKRVSFVPVLACDLWIITFPWGKICNSQRVCFDNSTLCVNTYMYTFKNSTRRSPYPRMTGFWKYLSKGNLIKVRTKIS